MTNSLRARGTGRRLRRPRPGTGWAFWLSEAGGASEAGFTLVETLLTVALLGVVVTAFVFFQSTAMRQYDLGRQQSGVEQTLRFALDLEARELRQAWALDVARGGSRIDYTDRAGRPAAFYLDAPSHELRQEVVGGAPAERVIAEGVQNMSFELLPGPSPLVVIHLAVAEGGQNRAATTLVAVRQP